MPFPLSCSGRIPLAEAAPPHVILHRLEQELRVRGVREIRCTQNELYFGQVSLDRGKLDLFTPISSGRLVLANVGEVSVLQFDVSLLRSLVVTTLVWPVFGIFLSLGRGSSGVFELTLLTGLWLASNLISYFSTTVRFRQFLERSLYSFSALPD